MISITVKYEDYEENQREESLLFHLNKNEIAKLELKYKGIQEHIAKLQTEENKEGLYEFIEDIVVSAYGVKSESGSAFVKTPAIVEEFKYGPALPEVMITILEKEKGKGIADFIMGCMSKEARQRIIEAAKTDPQIAMFVGN